MQPAATPERTDHDCQLDARHDRHHADPDRHLDPRLRRRHAADLAPPRGSRRLGPGGRGIPRAGRPSRAADPARARRRPVDGRLPRQPSGRCPDLQPVPPVGDRRSPSSARAGRSVPRRCCSPASSSSPTWAWTGSPATGSSTPPRSTTPTSGGSGARRRTRDEPDARPYLPRRDRGHGTGAARGGRPRRGHHGNGRPARRRAARIALQARPRPTAPSFAPSWTPRPSS